MQKSAAITTVEALVMAAKDSTVHSIVVMESLAEVPSIRLSPGQSLQGNDNRVTLAFSSDAEGLQLSSDNRVQSLRLEVLPTKRAISMTFPFRASDASKYPAVGSVPGRRRGSRRRWRVPPDRSSTHRLWSYSPHG